MLIVIVPAATFVVDPVCVGILPVSRILNL